MQKLKPKLPGGRRVRHNNFLFEELHAADDLAERLELHAAEQKRRSSADMQTIFRIMTLRSRHVKHALQRQRQEVAERQQQRHEAAERVQQRHEAAERVRRRFLIARG